VVVVVVGRGRWIEARRPDGAEATKRPVRAFWRLLLQNKAMRPAGSLRAKKFESNDEAHTDILVHSSPLAGKQLLHKVPLLTLHRSVLTDKQLCTRDIAASLTYCSQLAPSTPCGERILDSGGGDGTMLSDDPNDVQANDCGAWLPRCVHAFCSVVAIFLHY